MNENEKNEMNLNEIIDDFKDHHSIRNDLELSIDDYIYNNSYEYDMRRFSRKEIDIFYDEINDFYNDRKSMILSYYKNNHHLSSKVYCDISLIILNSISKIFGIYSNNSIILHESNDLIIDEIMKDLMINIIDQRL